MMICKHCKTPTDTDDQTNLCFPCWLMERSQDEPPNNENADTTITEAEDGDD